MTNYRVEKGVPLPLSAGQKGKNKYPWYEMEVGDSFFVPGDKRGSVHNSASGIKSRTGLCFSCSVVTENGVKGVRVWRIADKTKADE